MSPASYVKHFMKILHTADIHLREYHDERWLALEELVNIGRKEGIGLLAISGDLFNEGINAENLRAKIRELFSNNGFPVVIIPGNHDVNSYPPGHHFGNDVHIIRNITKPFEQNEARIWGLPFEDISGGTLLTKLHSIANELTPDKTNILLYHGELEDSYFTVARNDNGEEGFHRYMPAKLTYFDKLNFQYVLAGHFHTSFDVFSLWNNGYFVYPGSPISITNRETGQRKVNLFQVGEPPNGHLLDTPHYTRIALALDPMTNQNPVALVRECMLSVHPTAKVTFTISGYFNGEALRLNEAELENAFKVITAECGITILNEARDVKRILEDDLFKTFRDKLMQQAFTEKKNTELCQVAIKAMIEAGL